MRDYINNLISYQQVYEEYLAPITTNESGFDPQQTHNQVHDDEKLHFGRIAPR